MVLLERTEGASEPITGSNFLSLHSLTSSLGTRCHEQVHWHLTIRSFSVIIDIRDYSARDPIASISPASGSLTFLSRHHWFSKKPQYSSRTFFSWIWLGTRNATGIEGRNCGIGTAYSFKAKRRYIFVLILILVYIILFLIYFSNHYCKLASLFFVLSFSSLPCFSSLLKIGSNFVS